MPAQFLLPAPIDAARERRAGRGLARRAATSARLRSHAWLQNGNFLSRIEAMRAYEGAQRLYADLRPAPVDRTV